MQSVETVIGCLGLSHRSLFHSLDWVHRLWCKFLSDGWDSRLSACTRSSCQLKTHFTLGQGYCGNSGLAGLWCGPGHSPRLRTDDSSRLCSLSVCLLSAQLCDEVFCLAWIVFLPFFFMHVYPETTEARFFFSQSLRPGRICNWMCVVEILFRKKLWLWEACGFFSLFNLMICNALILCVIAHSHYKPCEIWRSSSGLTTLL